MIKNERKMRGGIKELVEIKWGRWDIEVGFFFNTFES